MQPFCNVRTTIQNLMCYLKQIYHTGSALCKPDSFPGVSRSRVYRRCAPLSGTFEVYHPAIRNRNLFDTSFFEAV